MPTYNTDGSTENFEAWIRSKESRKNLHSNMGHDKRYGAPVVAEL
jgi:hypothetical protein